VGRGLVRNRPLVVALWAVVAVLVVLVVVGIARGGTHAAAHPRCTHGVSSIGPVEIVDGKVVGSTKPHTQACLP
jgi:hypothetical protein